MVYTEKQELTLNRSEEDLLEVAWYLSKYGKSQPPVGLGVQKWKEAIALFYPRFGEGKTAVGFYNSLKNSRDRFDSWVNDTRVGWRDEQGAPAELSHSAQRVHQRLNVLSENVIEQRVLSLISSDGDEQAQRDCLAIQQDKSIEDTVREQLIAARLGQGTFRKNCLMLYPACPVTGTTFAPLLRASHIKPWAACANGNERLDPHNGIILAAHIDILFDQGWISFRNDGYLLISNELDIGVKEQLLLPEKIKAFSVESYCYLEWHREHLLR